MVVQICAKVTVENNKAEQLQSKLTSIYSYYFPRVMLCDIPYVGWRRKQTLHTKSLCKLRTSQQYPDISYCDCFVLFLVLIRLV